MASERIIYPEWTRTLVDLRISLPAHCLKGCRGNGLHQGMITMFLENRNGWLSKLDNENDPQQYPMGWDIVCDYTDNEAGIYLSYSVPDKPIDLPPDQASLQQ